jgi:curved DNA-binding protein CbpA
MGNGASGLYDPTHASIYRKLLQIQNPQTRVGTIQTLLAGPEYVAAARKAGIYAHLLAYVARVNAGERPAPLPGEVAVQAQAPQPAPQLTNQIVSYGAGGSSGGIAQSHQRPAEFVAKQRRSEKAMNYFQNCLLVLNLEEEVALNEDSLRKAYKAAAVKAHPDKGGSEQEFEAVTRAYAYLVEILRRVQGGRSKEGKVEAPTVLKDSRTTEAKDWQHVEPVRLNPKKLDMNAFNQMFEQTRIPDPDDEGYGDWLKGGGDGPAGPKFGGKFNRDVFNQAFEAEAAKARASSALSVAQPQALTLGVNHGVELGRESAGDYTAAANASVKYTDLKQAYTNYNTFSGQVAGVSVEGRSFDAYSASRKKAPEPLSNREMEAIQAAEAAAASRERGRAVRAAQEMSQADEYFQRMKQMVLLDGKRR